MTKVVLAHDDESTELVGVIKESGELKWRLVSSVRELNFRLMN